MQKEIAQQVYDEDQEYGEQYFQQRHFEESYGDEGIDQEIQGSDPGQKKRGSRGAAQTKEGKNNKDNKDDNKGYYDNWGPGPHRRSQRVIDSIETRQQLSGCLFGFVGLIVLGFSIFLIHNGTISERSTEIDEYVKNVTVSIS